MRPAIKIATVQFFWMDSIIVLHWLDSSPSRWKTFIANRVSEIQHMTVGALWAHIPGIENPADIISRGMDPEQLQHNSVWWHGLDWLAKPSHFWPNLKPPSNEVFSQEELEERPVSMATQAMPPNPIFALRSSYIALVRLVAWMKRFSHNANPRNRTQRKLGFFSLQNSKRP